MNKSERKMNQAVVKRDTLINWEKAKNYIPLAGTIIIIDMPDRTIQLKIGDGETLVNDLPDILNMKKRPTIQNNTLIL